MVALQPVVFQKNDFEKKASENFSKFKLNMQKLRLEGKGWHNPSIH